MKKVSIIIPVYKVEMYISRCLDSILNQIYTEWEAILIDDCSPDKSGEICDEYAKKDSRFKVIHREKNGGASAARNQGLEIATGEYIAFIDSDDYVTEKYLTDEKDNIDIIIDFIVAKTPLNFHTEREIQICSISYFGLNFSKEKL